MLLVLKPLQLQFWCHSDTSVVLGVLLFLVKLAFQDFSIRLITNSADMTAVKCF